MRYVLLLLSLTLLLGGCNRPSPPPAPAQGTSVVTDDDIAHAMGMHWWIVDVGQVPPDKTLCLAFVDQHGIIESRACPQVSSGEQVRVVLSDLEEYSLRYSAVVGDVDYRSVMNNYYHQRYLDGPTTFEASNTHVSPGDFIMKKSNVDSTSGTASDLQDGEIAITLTFQDEAQPWQRKENRWWLAESTESDAP